MILIGAPPQEEAKYDGDHSMFCQYRFLLGGFTGSGLLRLTMTGGWTEWWG